MSNLQVPDWQQRLAPTPGTLFAGVLDYLSDLSPNAGTAVVRDNDKAWARLRQAVIRPRAADADVLTVSGQKQDFGVDTESAARPWQGPLAAVRGPAMWREGDIARARTAWRSPLLAGIEAAYAARWLYRRANDFRR